jgi:hypothetical protein
MTEIKTVAVGDMNVRVSGTGFPLILLHGYTTTSEFWREYVTEGEFRFGLNDETSSVLAAGQAFYEPPGANHTAGDSANAQRAVRILAIIIAPLEKI